MTDSPLPLEVPVDGEVLAAFRYGAAGAPPSRTVLAVHGITASSRAWPAVARALPDDWALVAVDLRGRGASRDLPPGGLGRHADDVLAVARTVGCGVLLGHSMGAYVATLAAAAAPRAFERVVLVDGAVPLPVPPGADPDAVLDATLGPALQRLSQVFADEEAYVDVFRAHPALAASWNDDVETYARYDALPVGDGVRSRAVEAAVRADGRDLLTLGDRLDAALRGLTAPTVLLTAPGGMFGDPPGLLPADAVARYAAEVDALTVVEVEGTNHYTILFAPDAARTVAEAVTGAGGWSGQGTA
ncbi:alpha/beta fold hydrolase [Nocardioides litoris]|uniref:alpha/beta fold hydrolase n=1 Tax=Nocardioides litoris TaxID=1926648 RepID=UPI001122BCEB|nr:alpha/beta hydrolase [Nocardioides litoris]